MEGADSMGRGCSELLQESFTVEVTREVDLRRKVNV